MKPVVGLFPYISSQHWKNMSEIVDFAAAKQEREPHWSGEAYCVGCYHTWVAVAPMGVHWITCPSCHTNRGTPRYPFGPTKGDAVLTCAQCGGEALYAFKRDNAFYVRCMGCGNDLTEVFYDG
jgi:hypothetical protein